MAGYALEVMPTDDRDPFYGVWDPYCYRRHLDEIRAVDAELAREKPWLKTRIILVATFRGDHA